MRDERPIYFSLWSVLWHGRDAFVRAPMSVKYVAFQSWAHATLKDAVADAIVADRIAHA